MNDIEQQFFDALIAGFPPYARHRAAALGLDSGPTEAAVHDGVAILERDLVAALAVEGGQPVSTPLEVVRAALEPLGAALAEGGVPEPDRDSDQAAILPSDRFNLAPATAAEIGDAAGEAALLWGATRAAYEARPLMLVVSTNLMDVGPFEAAAGRIGYRCVQARLGQTPRTQPAVVFVDLEVEGADDAVAQFSAAGVRVIAYGPHVDGFALARARSLGASAAEPRSRVLRDPSVFVSPVV
jgi:hypothetical protein